MGIHYTFKQVYEVNDVPVYWLETVDETRVLHDILLEKSQRFAIDQERAPYTKYYFQIPCLLQLATTDFIVFIDLLKEKNISEPLVPILESPNMDKIFFDAPWDLFYFKEFLNINIKETKDIQVCSSLLYPTIGTASLVKLAKEELNIDIRKPKSQQKSDWTKRPLSTEQIHYASHEIIWFLPIFDILFQKLQKKRLESFFNYGNSRLGFETPNLEYSPLQMQRIKGFQTLSNKEKHRLLQLGLTRDKIARKRNRPTFFFLTNQQLLNLAREGQSLETVCSSSQKLNNNVITQFQEALNQTYPDTPFSSKSISFSDYPLLKQQLLTWRFAASKRFKLPKRLIISKSDIDNFDDSCFENQTSLLRSLWFTNKKDPLCQKLTSDITMFLQSASSD